MMSPNKCNHNHMRAVSVQLGSFPCSPATTLTMLHPFRVHPPVGVNLVQESGQTCHAEPRIFACGGRHGAGGSEHRGRRVLTSRRDGVGVDL